MPSIPTYLSKQKWHAEEVIPTCRRFNKRGFAFFLACLPAASRRHRKVRPERGVECDTSTNAVIAGSRGRAGPRVGLDTQARYVGGV